MLLVIKIHIVDRIAHQAPDWVFLWVDPYWSGRWTPSTDLIGQSDEERDFNVVVDLNPLPPASLELWAREKYTRDRGQSGWRPTMCDSVKLHFHSQRNNVLEMRYATNIQLTSLRPGLSHTLGAWTTAKMECDKTGQDIAGVEITLTTQLVQQTSVPLPMLTASELPDLEHHVRMKAVGDWIADVLGATYGEKCTGFVNIRTVLQDKCMTTFFPDIPSIIQPHVGTTLPPTLAVYSVCNALRIHRLSASTFLSRLQDTGLVLRVVRDMLVPWTMCRLEGQYEADRWCGEACEDQPFTNTLKPGIRVWPIDDCEGRNQEACIHAVLMFKWIYLDTTQNSSRGVKAHFARYPPNTGCLSFSGAEDPDFSRLLDVCCAVGNLLYARTLQTHMAVGDVYFHGKLESHSFGLLVYTDVSNDLYDGIVMETTAWDMTVDDDTAEHCCRSRQYTALSQVLDVVAKEEASSKQRSLGIRRAASVSSRQGVYRGIFTGTDCLFFGKHGLSYGIQLADLRHPLPELSTWDEIQKCETAFKINIMNFLRVVSARDSCWKIPTDSTTTQPAILVDYYATYLKKRAAFARSLRPPPQPESEYMCRMGSWGALGSEQIMVQEEDGGAQRIIAPSDIMAFAWKTDELSAMPALLYNLVDSMVADNCLLRHPCMHSTLFTCVSQRQPVHSGEV